MAINFLPERLRMLMERNRISMNRIGKITGVGESTINAILNRPNYKTSLNTLLKISEFFDIPLDYFFNRCSDKQAQQILNGGVMYASFQEIRRMSYEECMLGGRIKNENLRADKYEAPWPYNLAEDIFGEPVDWIITDEQLADFEELICKSRRIEPREEGCLFGYYRNGATFTELGIRYGVGKERIRQIIKKAIRKLSNPATANLLRYNYEALVKKHIELEKKNKELEKKNKELETIRDILERDIEALRETKDATEKEMISNSLLALRGDMTVAEMDLSVRAHNCLIRGGCHTLNDVVDAANNDRLLKIRNLGELTKKEILDKVEELTGLTFASKTEHSMIQL